MEIGDIQAHNAIYRNDHARINAVISNNCDQAIIHVIIVTGLVLSWGLNAKGSDQPLWSLTQEERI